MVDLTALMGVVRSWAGHAISFLRSQAQIFHLEREKVRLSHELLRVSELNRRTGSRIACRGLDAGRFALAGLAGSDDRDIGKQLLEKANMRKPYCESY